MEGVRSYALRSQGLLGLAWGTLVLLFVVSCAGPRVRPPVAGGQVGIASWYGPKFHGRRTASGEVFNMHQLTAAHRTLPLGSWVQVTNLENDRSIQVRVNDRGPFVRGRIIDVSYAAARALGMVRQGVARVQVWPLRASPSRLIRAPRAYTLQAGSFLERRNAVELKTRLDALSSGSYISKISSGGETFYRVRLGRYTSREAARRAAMQVAAYGFTVILMDQD